MRFQFIRARKAEYPVKTMCRLLEVSRSGFYRWNKMTASKRAREDAKLRPRIAASHAASGETYGSPRVQADLVAEGFEVGKNRVARLMREMGLYALPERRFRRTTDSSHGLGFATDLVQRDFNPSAPNRVWASDITYVWTDDGWAYLAVVLDLFSRRVVGWAIAEHMRTELVLDALGRALSTREVDEADLTHHSDRGSQYASEAFTKRLEQAGVKWSMGATGCCFDNAAAESFFATLKKELIHRNRYRDLAAARVSINAYINCFYNSRRRHSALGYLSPIDFETMKAQHQPEAAYAA
jgi:putative transposase